MIQLLLLSALTVAGGLEVQSPDFDLPIGLPQLEAAARNDSNDAAAHYNLALGYWKSERDSEAEREFRAAIRLDPDFAPPFVGLYALTQWRWAYWRTRRSALPPEAKRQLEDVEPMFWHALVTDPLVDLKPLGAALPPVPIDPMGRAAWEAFGRGPYDLYDGDYQAAFSELSKLISSYPHQDRIPAHLLLWRGLAAEHLGLDTTARADFQRLSDRATTLDTTNEILHFPTNAADYDYLLGLALMRVGRTPEAVRYFHNALVADAGLYEAHSRLAEIAEAGEDWEDAVAERRAAADANPEDSHLLMYLGATLLKSGQSADAEAPLRQAVVQNPRDFQSQFVLGIVELRLGKNAEARTALTAAVAQTPSRYQAILQDARKRLASIPP